MKEFSAGAIIFRKANSDIYYLLLHYEAGHWDFPKGHIEKGESEEDATKREIKEETGIEDIKIIDGFKEWVKYFYRNTYGLSDTEKKKVGWTFKIVNFYLAETKAPHQNGFGTGQAKDVQISSEHIGYKWLPYDEAIKQLTFKNAKEILQKAHFFLTGLDRNDWR